MARSKEAEEAIKYLMAAKKSFPKYSQADQIKVALVRFFLDQIGEEDKAVRVDVGTAFMEMPSWFGASANAMQECPDYVKRVDAATKEFTDI
jgi:hypothetical protein